MPVQKSYRFTIIYKKHKFVAKRKKKIKIPFLYFLSGKQISSLLHISLADMNTVFHKIKEKNHGKVKRNSFTTRQQDWVCIRVGTDF